MTDRPDLIRKLREYSDRNDLIVGNRLGFGVHGIVFKANVKAEKGTYAVKVHEHETDYYRERDVYLRLEEHGVKEIRGFNVPELIGFDDRLWIIV